MACGLREGLIPGRLAWKELQLAEVGLIVRAYHTS
jgi:hypothetical protein